MSRPAKCRREPKRCVDARLEIEKPSPAHKERGKCRGSSAARTLLCRRRPAIIQATARSVSRGGDGWAPTPGPDEWSQAASSCRTKVMHQSPAALGISARGQPADRRVDWAARMGSTSSAVANCDEHEQANEQVSVSRFIGGRRPLELIARPCFHSLARRIRVLILGCPVTQICRRTFQMFSYPFFPTSAEAIRSRKEEPSFIREGSCIKSLLPSDTWTTKYEGPRIPFFSSLLPNSTQDAPFRLLLSRGFVFSSRNARRARRVHALSQSLIDAPLPKR